jgi:hypothetical protein
VFVLAISARSFDPTRPLKKPRAPNGTQDDELSMTYLSQRSLPIRTMNYVRQWVAKDMACASELVRA